MKASQILLLIFVLISFNLFSQSVEEYCQLGEEELSNDNFQKALEHFQNAFKIDSNKVEAILGLGSSYYFLEDFEKFLEYNTKGLSLVEEYDSTHAVYFFQRGYYYSTISENEIALENYNKAISLKESYTNAYFNIAHVYFHEDKFDDALNFCLKAFSIADSLQAYDYYLLAAIYSNKNEYKEAIEAYKKGLKLDDSKAEDVYFYLSIQYGELDNDLYWQHYLHKAYKMGSTLAIDYINEYEINIEYDFDIPNYELIEKNIKDKKSDFYYPKLWKRFTKHDTTLNVNDFHHLYYGYSFHKKYSPYSSYENLNRAFEIMDDEKSTNKDYKKALKIFDEALKIDPFSIKTHYYQALVYDLMKNSAMVEKKSLIMDFIVRTWMYSGNGLDKEFPLHLISVSNEYDLFFFFNLQSQEQSLVFGEESTFYDVHKLEENEYDIDYFYFDISVPFKYLNSIFGDLK